MGTANVPNPTIRRLSRYLRKLDELSASGTEQISSIELGKSLGLTPSQIRQDLNWFGEFGRQGYGYDVKMLRENLADILAMNRNFTAILVGAGNLGKALMESFGFTDCGVHLLCAFDTDPQKNGTLINDIPILSMDCVAEYVNQHNVDIAILTVPKAAAVTVAENLEGCGIRAFWNCTNVDLLAHSRDTIIENVHFADSLMALNYFIAERNDEIAKRENRKANRIIADFRVGGGCVV